MLPISAALVKVEAATTKLVSISFQLFSTKMDLNKPEAILFAIVGLIIICLGVSQSDMGWTPSRECNAEFLSASFMMIGGFGGFLLTKLIIIAFNEKVFLPKIAAVLALILLCTFSVEHLYRSYISAHGLLIIKHWAISPAGERKLEPILFPSNGPEEAEWYRESASFVQTKIGMSPEYSKTSVLACEKLEFAWAYVISLVSMIGSISVIFGVHVGSLIRKQTKS